MKRKENQVHLVNAEILPHGSISADEICIGHIPKFAKKFIIGWDLSETKDSTGYYEPHECSGILEE